MAESYYAARSRRDPAWRDAQVAAAKERARRSREQAPDAYRARRREIMRRCRARHAARGRTFHELLQRLPNVDPEVLQFVLRDEIARGRIVYRTTTRRYQLNGALPEDVRQAIRDL